MTRYWVTSPTWTESEHIDEGLYGTEESVCAAVQVEATTKREAKIKALRTEELEDWVRRQRSEGCSPFTGLKVAVDEACICPCEEFVRDESSYSYTSKPCASCQAGKHQMSQDYEDVFAER